MRKEFPEIQVVRADSACIRVKISNVEKAMIGGDQLYFMVKRKIGGIPIFTKRLTLNKDGLAYINFTPSELSIPSGRYYYDVKIINTELNRAISQCTPSNFYVKEVVNDRYGE